MVDKADLVPMRELARQSGVPAPTIKHYIREGLLPGPKLRTGKTMAYYDPAMVPRIRAIKELQKRRYLPLDVIKEVLDGADPYRGDETLAALEQALAGMQPPERRTRTELEASGMPSEQLDFFVGLGLLAPEHDERGEEVFSGDDLALLRTLGAARRAGISPEMLPYTIVEPYMKAIQNLVRTELAMFREGLARTDAEELPELVASATQLSEQLVLLLRRKLLLPTLRDLLREREAEGDERPNAPME